MFISKRFQHAPSKKEMPVPIPNNETQRLEALSRYDILDTPEEQAFDDFAFLASSICHLPIAMISFLDSGREWFKARIGIEPKEIPREEAFGAYTILGESVMIVEDTRKDQRFANNPFVTGDPHVRFYAGAPLVDQGGNALGSVCVFDHHPRQLSLQQQESLRAVARQVTSQLELRRISAELADTITHMKALRGLITICSHCRGIRDPDGEWLTLEGFVTAKTDAQFTHGICPRCLKLHHSKVYEGLRAEGKLS